MHIHPQHTAGDELHVARATKSLAEADLTCGHIAERPPCAGLGSWPAQAGMPPTKTPAPPSLAGSGGAVFNAEAWHREQRRGVALAICRVATVTGVGTGRDGSKAQRGTVHHRQVGGGARGVSGGRDQSAHIRSLIACACQNRAGGAGGKANDAPFILTATPRRPSPPPPPPAGPPTGPPMGPPAGPTLPQVTTRERRHAT